MNMDFGVNLRNNLLFPTNSSFYSKIDSVVCYKQQHYRRGNPLLVVAKKKNNNNDHGRAGGAGGGGAGGKGARDRKYANNNSEKHGPVNLDDWRDFRAKMHIEWQKGITDAVTHKEEGVALHNSKHETHWAHPMAAAETGSVLVAADKFDGIRSFERTVVLVLKYEAINAQKEPFGIVLNCPLHKKIKQMDPKNHYLRTTFADCFVHYGGPLEAILFLIKSEKKLLLSGFEEVVPGLYFGSEKSLQKAAWLVKKRTIKPENVTFFFGYAGWKLDQLQGSIAANYWYVAACSASLLFKAFADSSEGLREEILSLMGMQD